MYKEFLKDMLGSFNIYKTFVEIIGTTQIMTNTLNNLAWTLSMPTNSIWALEQQNRNYIIFSISHTLECTTLYSEGSCRTEE